MPDKKPERATAQKVTDRISRLCILMARAGYAPPAPSVRHLKLAATQITGLDDWGEEFPEEALERLFDSVRSEAELTKVGRFQIECMIVSTLVNRLTIQNTLAQSPEIRGRTISRPIFVTGSPRSGTTFLHRLLALDQGSRPLRYFESWIPCPPFRNGRLSKDDRIQRCDRHLRWLYRKSPRLKAMHFETAQTPTECAGLLSNSLQHSFFTLLARLPSYDNWLDTQDSAPVYRYFREQLQILHDPGPGERWVLKSPSHRKHFASLFATFPDATVIVSHRDPLETIPSSISYRNEMKSLYSRRRAQRADASSRLARLAADATNAIRWRDENPGFRLHDSFYRDLVGDPVECIRRIYAFAGIEFSHRYESSIRSYLVEHPQDKFGRHRYSLDSSLLSSDDVRHAFSTYYTRYEDRL